MARRDLVEMYCAPEEYIPPVDKDFSGSTQFPNLNSEEYRRKFSLTPGSPEFHEALIVNGKGQVVVVTNDYRRRLWSGKFQLYENYSAFRDKQPALAQHPSQSPISSVVFQSNDKVLFGTATGRLELWNMQPAAKSETLGVYKIDSKSAHLDVVSKVELFAGSKTKFVTSSYDGCMKIWDLENREMMSTSTYHGAHTSAVTDVSVHPEEELFVSVSRDKSALVWDHRQVLPATGLLTGHRYHMTCCNWRENRDSADLIVIGDAKGDVFLVDRRVPDKIQSQVTVFDRPVRKIGRCGDSWMVCGNSTNLKRVKGDLSSVETAVEAKDWIRDFLVTDDQVQMILMCGDVCDWTRVE